LETSLLAGANLEGNEDLLVANPNHPTSDESDAEDVTDGDDSLAVVGNVVVGMQ
jgi:hypothetical protein